MNKSITKHTSTEIVPVNHKKLEIIRFGNNINGAQNGYKNKVDWILESNEDDKNAIKTEIELAKMFWITDEKIEEWLKKDNRWLITV